MTVKVGVRTDAAQLGKLGSTSEIQMYSHRGSSPECCEGADVLKSVIKCIMGADSASPGNTDPRLVSQVLPRETPTERLRA